MYGSHDGIRFFISKIQQNLNVDKTNLYFLMKTFVISRNYFPFIHMITLLLILSFFSIVKIHIFFFIKAHFFMKS